MQQAPGPYFIKVAIKGNFQLIGNYNGILELIGYEEVLP